MSKSLADIYTPSGHLAASLNCGIVTVTVRNAIGDHAAVDMSLSSWCGMIEQSRAKIWRKALGRKHARPRN